MDLGYVYREQGEGRAWQSETLPHGADDILEAAEKHGRREMHSLIRQCPVSLRRFAGAEEGEERTGQVELHELCDRQAPVAKAKAALKGVLRILNSVTGKVRQ
jgi:hypothetical protein